MLPFSDNVTLEVYIENSEDAVTQTFTGKELDRYDEDMSFGADGEGWYYFGARYYDPDVGLWVSCDPKNEFWSSYRYTTNPIGFIDPNGLEKIYIIASLGRAQTKETQYIENQLTLLKNRYIKAGYTVKMELTNSSVDNFKTALNDNEALRLFYVGHGGTRDGNSSIGFDDNTRFAPLLVNNNEYEGTINVRNMKLKLDVASCNQDPKQWKSSLPNSSLYGDNTPVDLVKASESYAKTTIEKK